MGFHRPMAFAGSWYPRNAAACIAQIREFTQDAPPSRAGATLGIVPHAGWPYSGRVAAQVFQRLTPDPEIDLVVVLGGHLGRRDPLIAMASGSWSTPFGDFPIHEGFAPQLAALPEVVLETQSRYFPDNSVELQLPFARQRYPRAELLPMRVPPNENAPALGRELGRYLRASGLRWVLIASTDLTHYGPNYGFEPEGRGRAAVTWMTRNDRAFIDAVATGSPQQVLDSANTSRNACSAGSVAALCACMEPQRPRFDLVAYASSADVPPHHTENMVGYMGAVFEFE